MCDAQPGYLKTDYLLCIDGGYGITAVVGMIVFVLIWLVKHSNCFVLADN